MNNQGYVFYTGYLNSREIKVACTYILIAICAYVQNIQ